MSFLVLFLVGSCAIQSAHAHYGSPDSDEIQSFERVIPTQGQVWPQPKDITSSPFILVIDPNNFEFTLKTSQGQCELAMEALHRYRQSLLFSGCASGKVPGSSLSNTRDGPSPVIGTMQELEVFLTGPCETMPHMDMDESYFLTVSSDTPPSMLSKSVWGIMRGLETFSQLVYPYNETHFAVNETDVKDAPRFSHRGLLIDTSRHFLPVHSIIDTLDAMAFNKMNVLHWHIVDDPSFPYVSEAFPGLSKKGAYNPETHTYSPSDVTLVLEEARKRGIRVLAEFDTPGHTQSWGKAYPELLTPCYKGTSPNGKYGPMNPALESTFKFLETFFEEAVSVFPDQYLHLGGDEVSFACWMSNPNITAFMERMGISGHYIKLEEYYIQRLLKIIEALRKSYIVWQEVFDNGVQVANDTVIHIWKQPQRFELSRVTQAGFRALLSSCWYLSTISYGSDWKTYYACDPQDFDGSPEQKALVLGGEACVWGEWVDATNLISRTWPRASAVAERLWSPATLVDPNAAAARFEEQRCRMLRRGLHAEPQNGPGFCECDHLL